MLAGLAVILSRILVTVPTWQRGEIGRILQFIYYIVILENIYVYQEFVCCIILVISTGLQRLNKDQRCPIS